MRYKIPQSNFLGNTVDPGKPYVIIGAGISGLFLGYQFKKAKIPFKIVEAKTQGGGLLQSLQTEYGLIERAANGFIWCKEIQAICDDLKLEILSPEPTSKARFIVKNKELRKLPISFFDGFRLAQAFFKKHPQPFNTLEDFGNYFIGKKLTQQIIDPAFSGIYGASAHDLSFPGAMSKLAKAFNETQYLQPAFKKMRGGGSKEERKKRAAGTHSFRNGMGELTLRLSEFLKNEIEWEVDGRSLSDEKENLVLTTPAHVAKDFFKRSNEQVYHLLSNVHYNSMISCTLFFEKSAFERFKPGFGCLIPRKEGLTILGVLFNSYIFDHRVKDQNLISLTCILRDDSNNFSFLNQTDNDFKELIVKDLDVLFGVNKSPIEITVSRWKNGIPLYNPALYKSWFKLDDLLKEKFPNRNLFGNYTGEISVRGLAQSSHMIFKYLI